MEIWVYSFEHDDTSRSAFQREETARELAEEDKAYFIYYFKER